MATEMEELQDRWILPLRGDRVMTIERGDTVIFSLDSGVRIVVGTGAYFTHGVLTGPDVEKTTVAQRDDDDLRRVLGSKVLVSVGFKSGALRVVFSTGWHLNVSSRGEFVPAAVIGNDTVLWARTSPVATGDGDGGRTTQ
jgi:hypothetical protein